MLGLPRMADLLQRWDQRRGPIPLNEMRRSLQDLAIRADELAGMVTFDDRAYRRTSIHASEHYEMLLLTWKSGQASPIHNHNGSSCAVLVVQGQATEILYRQSPCERLVPVRSHTMTQGQVTGCRGLCTHQLANLQQPGNDLITLHVYSPAPSGWDFTSLNQTMLAHNDRLIQERPATVYLDMAHSVPVRPMSSRVRRKVANHDKA